MEDLNFTSRFNRYTSLLVVICVLNALSMPWPKTLGVVEFLIAILIVFVFFAGYLQILLQPKISSFFILIFIIMSGHGFLENYIVDVMRDMIAFLYLGIPIAFYFFLQRHRANLISSAEKYDALFFRFLLSFSLVGVAYSVRAIWPFVCEFGFDFAAIYYSGLYPHTDYIFLDPSLVFGACFLVLYAIGNLKARNILYVATLIGLSLVAIAAPFFAVIRAPVMLYVIIILLALAFRFRYGVLLLLPLVLIFCVKFYGLAEMLLLKHSQSGANGKVDEFLSIINHMAEQPVYSIVFGAGFGGVYYSTVLDESVRFTHNIFSYALLKGGVFTLSVTLAVFVWIIIKSTGRLISFYKLKDTTAFASLVAFLASFLVSSLLEPGYKTLSYGFLLIVYVYFVHFRRIRPRVVVS